MAVAKPCSPKVVKSAFSAALYGIAREQMQLNDESLYRALTVGGMRFVVQAMAVEPDPYSKSTAAMSGRKRKFSNPVFLTPNGVIQAFPQADEDLFLDIESARVAIGTRGNGHQWEIASTSLTTLMKTKAYLRWKDEVAALPPGQAYVEPRRTLEESFSIYAQEGMPGLRKLYTRSHAWHLIAKFKEQGLM